MTYTTLFLLLSKVRPRVTIIVGLTGICGSERARQPLIVLVTVCNRIL